jgi:RNA polymerase sigma-70 factor, ECF subfamily
MTDPAVPALRAASGDAREQAWRELYSANFTRIYRLAGRFGVRTDDIEDVTQRIFLTAHTRLRETDEVRDVNAWLRGIAVKVVSEYHRWRRVRALKRWLVRSTADVERESKAPDAPDGAAHLRRQQARVAEVLARMSEKLRAVLVLLELEENRPSEVAETLQIPVNTVRSRHRLAREQFAEIWEKLYGNETPGGAS